MIRAAPAGHNSQAFDASALKAIVENVERLEVMISGLNGNKSALFQEAKSDGFDVPAIKKIIAERRMDPAKRDTLDAMTDLYRDALGSP